MNSAEPDPGEMQYVSLLEACEAALAAGDRRSLPQGENFSPELRQDLERDLAYVELLREVLTNDRSIVCLLPGKPTAGAEREQSGALPGTSSGRFQIRRELGRGTFGIVYLANDPQLGGDG